MVSARRFATVASSTAHAKVAIIGCGSAGISVASQLLNSAPELSKYGQVVLIDPASKHHYQPLFTLVGAGLKTMDQATRTMGSVVPKAARWLQSRVDGVDAVANIVHLADGTSLSYEALVIAPGIRPDYKAIEGLSETIGKNNVCTNYDPKHVASTFDFMRTFKGGKAIFTQPASPIKCGGAPQKIMYLFEDYLCRTAKDIRANTDISFFSGLGKLFAIPKYDMALAGVCANREINVNLLHELVAVDGPAKQAVFKVLGENGSKEVVVPFDFLHVSPPLSPPAFIKASGLTDGITPYVAVDKHTTQHMHHSNIFSLGDASSLPTSKTAAAIASESAVTTRNLLSFLSGQPISARYEGYTSCPLVTGKGKLILAEFNAYTSEVQESFHFDQAKESLLMYHLKADILDKMYWHGMLKGLWTGPSKVRGITNPFDRN
ncbi:hypothetical protein BC830DRAFT_1063315 [Chytriomyces sp. MP71]|nr:hypothetical protein BC830DRAFT_1063315 [Chytriomyces sp. MP71]